MDQKDSHSWSKRFLSIFGTNAQPGEKINNSEQQQRENTNKPSTSKEISTCVAASRENIIQVRQAEQISQIVDSSEQSRPPPVPERRKRPNTTNSGVSRENRAAIEVRREVNVNLQVQQKPTVPQRVNIPIASIQKSGSADTSGATVIQKNNPKEAITTQSNVANVIVRNSGRSITEMASASQNNYPEETVQRNVASDQRNGTSNRNQVKRVIDTNNDGHNGNWRSANNPSQSNEEVRSNMNEQQQKRSSGNAGTTDRSGNWNQRSGKNNKRRNNGTNDYRTTIVHDSEDKRHVGAQNNENRSASTSQASSQQHGSNRNLNRFNQGNQNQRRATMSQLGSGGNVNSNRSQSMESRRNSFSAHKIQRANPYHEQQFRNTGPSNQSVRNVQNKARNVAQSSENGNDHRRKDNQRTFFGLKKFENYLKMEPDQVVLSLHAEIDAFESFLKENRAYEGNMFETLLAVLSEKVFSDEGNLVSYQNAIVRLLATNDIMNRFRDKCMTLDDSKFHFMYNIADFMKRRMPVSAADSLSGVVTFCMARLGMIKDNPKSAELLSKFQELFKSFQEKRQHDEVEAKARKPLLRGKFTDYDLKSFDKIKPPDNFRETAIIPSVQELLSTEPSFLRPNKQSGSYADAEHYLDVQFRLLREDFLQPLKQGIQEWLVMRQKTNNPRMPKGSPIRLYYNVKCLTAEVKNENLHYWIQLHSDCSKIKWDKSRRLLPGNLILLTKNSASLDSVVFGTVGIRNDDDLKNQRKLTIIPENMQSCSIDVLNDDTDLLLIESEVYWESFRHVLKTAQLLNLNTFPLSKYIVRACTNVEPPPSLLDPLLQLDEEPDASTISLCFGRRNFMVDPFLRESWPRADMIGLDANQFEAFKAALTKQFVIIQGPPGTGKTFVGLRIAEVVLQNPRLRTGRKALPNDLGMYSEYRGPLLCICYTNHALDQFLEGILKIMNVHKMDTKIVRVGGRSKSEILREFNLREVARRTNRQLAGLQWREVKDIEMKMKQNQAAIQGCKQIVTELERPTGIVNFYKLANEIYQTLCFEFSSQLMDKLSSAKFFKLTNSDIYNIKENNVTDVVKKWFEYLKVNSNRNGKNAKAQDIRQEGDAEEDLEEFYDMDELMEHRIVVDDDDFDQAELKLQFECSNSVGRLQVDGMSMPQSKFLLKEYENGIQKQTINDNDTMNVVYAKQRTIAQIRENETVERKRLAILEEIFVCLNQKRVKIPDVTTKLESLRRFNTMDSKNFVDNTFPLIAQRYAAYLMVAKRAKQLMNEIIRELEKEMIERAQTVAQLKRQHEVEILKNAVVVGMTTTGAAKFNDLLVKMKSRIVIVEEAAEVLEAHIVTSLTKYTDHLILIGDHKQLKPSTAVYDLSRKYDLDVSLFERMINNNMTCYSLLAQHRMRSEIADLIRGSIYDRLNDSPNVHEYESITGMSKNLFFLTHDKFEKSEGDTLSKLNEFEADYLAGLAGYLLKQGYKPSSITVLTTYTGQMFLLKSKFRASESLQPVQITCVDNFQGEENDIILLSLVRSNPEGRMGFLSVSNRVCVALSRSKKGLYIIGNMKMLAQQKIWSEINSKLTERQQIGASMKVVCESHKIESEIANADDFNKKCPEGGCSMVCGVLMKCSHSCPRFCHTQDRKHENYRCRELCRKPCATELAHPCRLQCHFGKVCLPCNFQMPKSRSCGHNITTDCSRSAEAEYCKVKVKRLLKCDHEVTVDCSKKMEDWLCREIVDKILICGHESKLMCHTDPDQYKCKIEVKKKLPCTHDKNMKCFEIPAASMCKKFVEKQLPCGHEQTIECRFDPKEATCSVKVTKTLECEHTITVPCFKTKGKIDCVELCEERLSCGHSCPLKCHFFKDRHHDKFRCKKPCAKACSEGHPCMANHECSSQCKKCVTIVERKLPECGHIGKMYCFEPLAEYKCQEKCTKMLLCGHSCGKKCSDPCDPCKEKTEKRTPVCGHIQLVPCDENPLTENCEQKIKIGATLCGHEITLACNKRTASLEEIQKHCTEPCGFMFPGEDGCGHKCAGSCGSCVMGSLHQKCKDKCQRPLICGHLFPCSKNCPPCKEKCQMKCEHSKCRKMCGDACFICKERCSWRCKHKRCTKKCGELCDRGPCHEPCEKKLRCGHMCIGFCGEMCPPLCRICDLDKLTEFQLLYTEDEEDARFIWLPDCKHAIEVEGLTMHFNATDESGEIGLKKCPRCTTVICTTLSGRFANVIKKSFRDVAEVKKAFYGNREQNRILTEEIARNLQVEENNLLKYLPSVREFFEGILYFEEKPNSLTAKKLRPVDINTLNSLKQIWVWVKEILQNLSDYSNYEIRKDCDSIFGNIANRQLPLCAFEVDNIGNEIQRLVNKIQFNRRWDSALNASKERPEAKTLRAQILAALGSKGIYDEKTQQTVVACTKNLEKVLKTGLGISEVERLQIVKALNMTQGHWFKCPNGHPYIITECGGAMVTSKCNECGAPIGGGNHALLASNEFAPEMDGATRPAWDSVLVPQNFGF